MSSIHRPSMWRPVRTGLPPDVQVLEANAARDHFAVVGLVPAATDVLPAEASRCGRPTPR